MGSGGSRIDLKFLRFLDLITHFERFDGTRSIKLVTFLKDVRLEFNVAHVSDGIALLMVSRLVEKEATRLYGSIA